MVVREVAERAVVMLEAGDRKLHNAGGESGASCARGNWRC